MPPDGSVPGRARHDGEAITDAGPIEHAADGLVDSQKFPVLGRSSFSPAAIASMHKSYIRC